MDTADFFRQILPTQGLYVLAWRERAGKQYFRHVVVDDIDKLATKAQQLDAAGHTVYHACASYKESRVWDDRKQKWRVRIGPNTHSIRSQWLDLDVGSRADEYADLKSAASDLKAACAHFDLPAPTLVRSGRGLHAYWTFNQDLPASDAGERMRAFKGAIEQYGLRADRSRTSDIASVLRPPGTTHRKGKPKAVEVIYTGKPISPHKFYAKVGFAATTSLDLLATDTPLHITTQASSDWSATAYPPSSAKKIAQRCRAVNKFVRDKGQISEPAWFAMIGVLTHTVEGSKAIHKWSSGDPRYSKSETDEKIANHEHGPATCAHIEGIADMSPECLKCKYRGKITSPIKLGSSEDLPPEKTEQPAPKPQPLLATPDQYARNPAPETLPFWPKNYSWDGKFLYRFVPEQDKVEAHWKPISKILYYPFLRFETDENTRAAKFCALINGDKNRWRVFDIETTKIAEAQSLAYALGAHEVIYMPSAKHDNRQFVDDVLFGLRSAGIETTTYSSFGWHKDGFVIGNQYILKDRVEEVFLSEKLPSDLRGDLGQAGTGGEWTRIVDQVYNRAGAEPFQWLIACSFAAPLIALCFSDNWHGLPSALTGESGGAKSTTCAVACSIWGDPAKFLIQANEEGTTMKALIQRVSTMRHLPLVLDEITGRTTDELQSLLYALSNGRPKLRLRADGQEINPGQSWNTTTFVTGNLSITRMLSDSDIAKAAATQVRCFEIPLRADYVHDVFRNINAKQLIEGDLLSANYGVVGMEYLKFVVKHQARIRTLLQKERAKFAAKTQEETRERFYYDMVATAMVAAGIAKNLNMIHFDLRRLKQWAMNHILTLRTDRAASMDTAEDFLQAFMAYVAQHTLVTRYYRDGRQKIHDERVVEPPREVLARNAIDDRRFIVTMKAFKDWCQIRKINPGWLQEQLVKEGLMLPDCERQRVCKGTSISGAQATCLELVYDRIDNTNMAVPEYMQSVDKAKA